MSICSRIRGVALLAVLACAAPAVALASASLVARELRPRELKAYSLDPQAIGMSQCDSAAESSPGVVIAVCRPKPVRQAPGSLRVLVVDTRSSRPRVVYEGPSGGDEYYIRPSVFGGGEGDDSIVLAESGAEYSYGIGVYRVAADGKSEKLGYINLATPTSDSAVSAVPFARILRTPEALCVGFTRDLVRETNDGKFVTVRAGDASYVFTARGQARARCPVQR